MSGQNEDQILGRMAQNVAELQIQLQTLCRMLNAPESAAAPPIKAERALSVPSREHKLQIAIMEAIDELEESRKSFKSKRLEQLRKRLTQDVLES